MTKKMLIDATHEEETRVAVVSAGNKLEEFDFENKVLKQVKSNIYLVKVTRVEPSLQAAFVEYGGNRHGFLPFPEIHPDYYRIPVADREALIAEDRAIAEEEEKAQEEAEAAAEKQALLKEKEEKKKARSRKKTKATDEGTTDPEVSEDVTEAVVPAEEDDGKKTKAKAKPVKKGAKADDAETDKKSDDDIDEDIVDTKTEVDSIGGEDDADEEGNDDDSEDIIEKPRRRKSLKRRYKIQEVVKRNQIMLIQINKEERGNKGAAVTTYLSLPGRYCVLMPNSPRAGGVSRKVSNIKDRQRLKKILADLGVPDGMSVILRTAGVSRTKAEIKRDLDHLLALWNDIRNLTLESTAPALVHEEGNLVKRAIRDLYKRDIDEVLVAGEKSFNTAKKFMKALMPTHTKRIKQYDDSALPLFFKYQVESQIDAIYNPEAHMKSGGYIVINPTEALVSIDVNSGRATKGRHIEETALKTNLEAAEEVARQLRLRDLGGLVVIDFIDMEEQKNNRMVERKLKEAMQGDRARIQLGRISAFGLLELSRQRLRPSLVETSFEPCVQCHGTGLVRTIETTAVLILRVIEEEALRGRVTELRVTTPVDIALYLLNQKRSMMLDIEKRHSVRILVQADGDLVKPDFNIELLRTADNGTVEVVKVDTNKDKKPPISHTSNNDEDGNRKPRRRRNNRNRNRNKNKGENNNNPNQNQNQNPNQNQGNNSQNTASKPTTDNKTPTDTSVQPSADKTTENVQTNVTTAPEKGTAPKKTRRGGRRPKKDVAKTDTVDAPKVVEITEGSNVKEKTAKKPEAKEKAKKAPVKAKAEAKPKKAPKAATKASKAKDAQGNDNAKPAKEKTSLPQEKGEKKGWWQKLTD